MKISLAIALTISMLFLSPRSHARIDRKELSLTPSFQETLKLLTLSPKPFAPADSKDLSITPRFQETPEWCWLTVGQMVFEHYGIPPVNALSYQCGIVAAFAGPRSSCWSNCGTCPFPAGSIETIQRMLSVYPQGVAFLTRRQVSPLTSQISYSPLTRSQLKSELDNDRPVIVGISPSGFPHLQSEHVALVVGYDEGDEGEMTLTVNDPFPYDLPQFARLGNPYGRARATDNGDGSYSVDYDLFKRALLWRESIYEIRSGSHGRSPVEDDDNSSQEEAFQQCMSERPEACVEVCVEDYHYSRAVCEARMCRPDDPTNISSWRRICERRVRRRQ